MRNSPKDEKKEALDSLSTFAASTFTVTIFRFGIRLLKNIIFTRLLGPAERGVFSLLTTIPDLIISFGNLGFGLGSTYLAAKKRYDLSKVLGNTIVVTAVIGLFLMAVGYAVFSFRGILKGDVVTAQSFSSLVVFMIPFVILYNFSSDLLISIKEIHFINLLRLLTSALPIILLVFFWITTGMPLQSAMFAWAASSVLLGLWAIIKLLAVTGFSVQISLPYLREAFSFGSRGFISILSNAVTRRIDFLIVSMMAGAEALGYYAVAVSVAEMILSVSDAFSRPFLPIHFRLTDKSAAEFLPLVIRNVLFILILICLLVLISGKLIIILLFGREFLPAYPSLLFLLPGILALGIYSFLKVDIYGRDLPGVVSWNSVLAMAVNVVLNFILIPQYGIVGASVSSSIAYGLSSAILLISYRRLSGNSFQDILLVKKSDLKYMLGRLGYSGKP